MTLRDTNGRLSSFLLQAQRARRRQEVLSAPRVRQGAVFRGVSGVDE